MGLFSSIQKAGSRLGTGISETAQNVGDAVGDAAQQATNFAYTNVSSKEVATVAPYLATFTDRGRDNIASSIWGSAIKTGAGLFGGAANAYTGGALGAVGNAGSGLFGGFGSTRPEGDTSESPSQPVGGAFSSAGLPKWAMPAIIGAGVLVLVLVTMKGK